MFAEATLLVTLVGLFIASIADLRTGEIPDTISGGMAALLALIGVAAALFGTGTQPLILAVVWGIIYFIVAYILFQLGQWGGGDVKLFAGIGASLGILTGLGYPLAESHFVNREIPTLAVYFINMAFVSTPYVVLYTFALGIVHPRAFVKFGARMRQTRPLLTVLASMAPLALAMHFDLAAFAVIYSLVPLFTVASLYMKTVEDEILTKTIKVTELSDWDILSKDLVVDGELVATKRNIEGVTPEQVKHILELSKAGKIPTDIDIRWGVKFVPVLFLAFPATVWWGNLLEHVFVFIAGL